MENDIWKIFVALMAAALNQEIQKGAALPQARRLKSQALQKEIQ
jgi:hypothetical protein